MATMIVIRRVIPSDIHSIQNILKLSWLETYPNTELGITRNDIEELFKDRLSEESLTAGAFNISNMKENVIFNVAIDNVTNDIFGFCIVTKKVEYAQLQSIYIHPNYQNKGIGRLLLDESLKEINHRIIVHVATYNQNAIAFYKKYGFRDEGKRFTEERHRMPISKVLIPEMELVKD